MTTESFCYGCSRSRKESNLMSSCFLIVLLGIVNLPCGLTHIASVLETDGAPGTSKFLPRGPTVAPVPSPETLDQLSQLRSGDDSSSHFFSPAEAIRHLLTLSSSSPSQIHGLKRVSQFHGNGDFGSGSSSAASAGTYYRSVPSWDYEDNLGGQEDEDGKPTFVPFIGARALTNIPQFFEHLKENIEALKHPSLLQDMDDLPTEEELIDSIPTNEDDNDDFESLPKKDHGKPAARQMKTELLVDENNYESAPETKEEAWSPRQGWKPRAAGIIHYYASRPNFLETQQNILRRANNYNPAWLYTNLGLGKRRR